MFGHHRREATGRSLPVSGREGRRRARLLAALLFSTAALAQACGDGSTPTGGNGGSTTTTSGTAGSGGSNATSGTGGSTSGTGAASTGGSNATSGTGGVSTGGSGTGTGGVSTGGSGTGTAGTGGVSTGSSGNGGSGVGGAGGASTGSGTGGSGGIVGQGGNWAAPPPIVVPPLPAAPDYSGYPVDSQGRPIVSKGAGINWVVRLVPDAISARERCAELVSNCFEPGVRSIDACMMWAPHCSTQTPWNEPDACCADECFVAYAALRTAKVDPLTAYLRVLYDSPICMPGVDAMLGGAP